MGQRATHRRQINCVVVEHLFECVLFESEVMKDYVELGPVSRQTLKTFVVPFDYTLS